MSEEQIKRIKAAMQTLYNCLADIETLAKAVKERDDFRQLLQAIVDKVERGADGDLYARDGSGLRLLPRDMIDALEAAKAYLEQGAIAR